MSVPRIPISMIAAATLALACQPQQPQECPKPEPQEWPECPEPAPAPEPPSPQSIIATYGPSTPWTGGEVARDSECQLGMVLVSIGAYACCCWEVEVLGVTFRFGCVCGGVPGGGANGGACFAAGTEVTLADGSTRAIEQLGPGDEVLSVDPTTKKLVGAKVLALETVAAAKVPLVEIDGLAVSVDHPVVIDDRLVPAGLLGAGDLVYKLGAEGKRGLGDEVEQVAIEAVGSPRAEAEPPTLYSLDVDGPNTFFVRSILVHEKLD